MDPYNSYDPNHIIYQQMPPPVQQPVEFLYARGVPMNPAYNQNISGFMQGVRHQMNSMNGHPQIGGMNGHPQMVSRQVMPRQHVVYEERLQVKEDERSKRLFYRVVEVERFKKGDLVFEKVERAGYGVVCGEVVWIWGL